MKIAVIGAAGNAGSRVVREALSRGHVVTAIGPHLEKLETLKGVKAAAGDVTRPAELAEILSGHDVVVSAVRFTKYDPDDLLASVSRSDAKRLVVVGGAGTLNTTAGIPLADSPTFPEVARPEAAAGKRVLDRLRVESDVDWVFISPSAMFAPGERLGLYRTGGDDLLVGEDGSSGISMEDYAIALLDEIEAPRHIRTRFTVGY